MKVITGIVCLLMSIVLIQCSASKSIPFEYPEDIKETEKEAFEKRFKKGQVLYDITCARCHNIAPAGKTAKNVIPDFSLPQLMDYEIRIQYPAHAEDFKESNLSVQELDDVVDFLRYKIKNKQLVRK